MSKIGIPLEGFAEKAREAAAEGAVLLKNEGEMLPVKMTEKVSVFGRCQIDYYRSGTGSGGSVQVPYTTNLLGGLRAAGQVVNEELAAVYEEWIRSHPFDNGGGGWAAEPWNQLEMPVEPELIKAARAVSAKALIVIGRTAGEEKDNADAAGSLRLTAAEENLLEAVNAGFEQVAVILNVSNIMDLSFMNEPRLSAHVKALMYVWHGGMEGGNAAADLILGRVSPSGKLPDTQAAGVKDYPSAPYYGSLEKNFYVEDIYVGYRYFETFHPEQVMYEFGYGRSYTDFEITATGAGKAGSGRTAGAELCLKAVVRNIGTVYSGKEVVQVYYEAPQGRLGQPVRQLLAFQKTVTLAPGESQELEFIIPAAQMKTYDDSGLSGTLSAYVMEAGEYHIFIGSSSRRIEKVMTYTQENCQVLEQLEEALAPSQAFERMRPGAVKPDGTYELQFEPVPLGRISLPERIQERLPETMLQTGNQGIVLADVKAGRASLETFVAQFNNEELAMIVRGEGMEHSDVTAGTASAFGGVGETLENYGLPLACTSDGPSGIRMSPEYRATQVPIGTLLAASFNTEMVEELYVMEGRELNRNEIDLLLGPGMNIHRNPMNGRNFEYFSEDPLLTGEIAAAVVKGIAAGGAGGTIKHFATNNQETARTEVDSILSERAAREIYLRGFEIAVKKGGARAVMTTYNPLNGHWTASNYDLNTTVLRREWGFEGIVMTDWWAKMNSIEEGGTASWQNMRDMVRAGNDLYMVVNNYGAEANSAEDDLLFSLESGSLTVGELQQRALCICRFLLDTEALNRPRKTTRRSYSLEPMDQEVPSPEIYVGEPDTRGGIPAATVPVRMSETIHIGVKTTGEYNVFVHMMSVDFNTAQTGCDLYVNGEKLTGIAARGSEGQWITQKLLRANLKSGSYSLRVEEVKPHLVVDSLRFELIK